MSSWEGGLLAAYCQGFGKMIRLKVCACVCYRWEPHVFYSSVMMETVYLCFLTYYMKGVAALANSNSFTLTTARPQRRPSYFPCALTGVGEEKAL